MEVRFANADLDRLETDGRFDGGFPPAIVKSFRRRMQQLRASDDERAFYALKSLHFEKLKGARAHQHSMRLNDQWRLILELRANGDEKVIYVVAVEDYH